MVARLVDLSKDYEHLCEWWRQYNWPVVEKDYLSKTGIMMEDNSGKRLCAGFFFPTDTKMAVISFIISDKTLDREQKDEALDNLIYSMCDLAKKIGFDALFATTNHKNLIDRYSEHKFIKTDLDAVNLLRRL